MSAHDRYVANLAKIIPNAGQIIALTGVSMVALAQETVSLADKGELAGCYPDDPDEWRYETDYAAEDVPLVLSRLA